MRVTYCETLFRQEILHVLLIQNYSIPEFYCSKVIQVARFQCIIKHLILNEFKYI